MLPRKLVGSSGLSKDNISLKKRLSLPPSQATVCLERAWDIHLAPSPLHVVVEGIEYPRMLSSPRKKRAVQVWVRKNPPLPCLLSQVKFFSVTNKPKVGADSKGKKGAWPPSAGRSPAREQPRATRAGPWGNRRQG